MHLRSHHHHAGPRPPRGHETGRPSRCRLLAALAAPLVSSRNPPRAPAQLPSPLAAGAPGLLCHRGCPGRGAAASNFTLGATVFPNTGIPMSATQQHSLLRGGGGALLLCVHEPSPARLSQDTAQTPFSAPRIWGPRLPPRAASPALRTVTVPLAPATGVGRGTALGPRGAGSSPGKGRTRGTGAASPGQAHALRPIRIFRGVPAGALPSSWERGGLGQGAGWRASLLPPATSPLACGSAPPPPQAMPKGSQAQGHSQDRLACRSWPPGGQPATAARRCTFGRSLPSGSSDLTETGPLTPPPRGLSRDPVLSH